MRKIALILLALFYTPCFGQFHIQQERTVTEAVSESEWVSTIEQNNYGRCWTITFYPGQCAADDTDCTPGTAPTSCVAQIEGCSEANSDNCDDPADVIVTSSTVADCSSKTALFHDENFRWLRVSATTFSGTGTPTMRVVFFGTP